jgi:hypothetical protein
VLIAPDVIAPDDKLKDGNGNENDGSVDKTLDAGIIVVQSVRVVEIVVDRQDDCCCEGWYDDIYVGVHHEGVNGMPLD